ncbi:MAG: SDR family oxidoreductase [Acidobacteria bacterium]|nr:SDR family oxidoreductase [Acidobacteriota bacterium]
MSLVSLITGGTRGIGFAIAERLLARGHDVAVTGTTSSGAARAEHALAGTCGDPGRVLGLVCDVRDPAAVDLAVETVVARFGGLDVLVNNAGVGGGAPVSELPYDEWRRIIDTNLSGVFYGCRAALPHLKARGRGWIVNLSSLASTNAFAGGAAYCASKAGLNAFTEALMQEVRHDDIRVSCILPGSVATGFSGREPETGADWKLSPDDVARVVEDLLDHPGRSLPSRVEIRPSRPPG